MAAYVYILHCSDGQYYYGCTGDLSQRLARHNEGASQWTSSRRPLRLVYFEECQTLAQARRRERALKNGSTRRKTIDALIRDFPSEKLARFA